MRMNEKRILRTALLYGEGKHEYIFLKFLLGTRKFKFLEKDWFIEADHASGCSCKDILMKCIKTIANKDWDVVQCFIDTDDLKNDFPDNFEKKIVEFEALALENGIEIVWQEENLEDVLRVATNGKMVKKGILKKNLNQYEELVLRSESVKRLFNRFYKG